MIRDFQKYRIHWEKVWKRALVLKPIFQLRSLVIEQQRCRAIRIAKTIAVSLLNPGESGVTMKFTLPNITDSRRMVVTQPVQITMKFSSSAGTE
jgi:hypothetical protein